MSYDELQKKAEEEEEAALAEEEALRVRHIFYYLLYFNSDYLEHKNYENLD